MDFFAFQDEASLYVLFFFFAMLIASLTRQLSKIIGIPAQVLNIIFAFILGYYRFSLGTIGYSIHNIQDISAYMVR